ncbi:MAG: tetratricopeptide repeat protein [Clostridiales bacterium]|nr:tetratricopeptide repeat protein [Clostridiales bacterium]
MKKQSSIMVWLMLAAVCAGLLPDMAETVIETLTGDSLSGVLSFAVSFVTGCLGLVFFLQAVSLRFGKRTDGTEQKPDKIFCLLGCFPCLLVYLIVWYLCDHALPVLAVGYVVMKVLFTVIIVVAIVVLLVLSGLGFFCWMNSALPVPQAHPIRRYFSRIFLGIPMAVLLWAALLVPAAGLYLLQQISGEPAILLRHLVLLAGTVVMAVLLYAAMALTEKMMGKVSEEGAAASASGVSVTGRRYLPRLVMAVLCAGLFFSQNMAQITENESALLDAWLQNALIEYNIYLVSLDVGGAAAIAEEAVEQMDSALLSAEEAEQETEQDAKALKKAERNTEKIEEICEKYDIFRTDGQALAYWEQYKKYGGADTDLVEEALLLAEENPDSYQVQYVAAMIASSLTYVGAKHYDQTAEVILRCGELYESEMNPSETEWITFAKGMAQMLLDVYHEEEAADLLEELADTYGDDVELIELLAQSYERGDRAEEAYALAVEYCADHDDSPYLMYCAAVSALKQGETYASLSYTSMLASYTAACEGDDLNNCDAWLFELLEYLTLNDNAKYTGFQYDVYDDLTDEENALIDENPFFRNYLDGVYLAYNSDHLDEPEDAFDLMTEVLSENPALASAWYVCGIIASNTDDDTYTESAVVYYQRAGELNDQIPAVWYAMAKEYDRLGEYEAGIEACQKALALLPEEDHGNDWYGINIHCSNLLDKLQAAVE